jgi:hypothetical protein
MLVCAGPAAFNGTDRVVLLQGRDQNVHHAAQLDRNGGGAVVLFELAVGEVEELVVRSPYAGDWKSW